MTTRKQIKKHHKLQRETQREALERNQFRGRVTRVGIAGVLVLAALGLAVFLGPWGSSGGEAEANLPVISLAIGDNFFNPDTLTVKAGQTYKLSVRNQGLATHDVWFAGSDNKSSTGDDVRSKPLTAGAGANLKIKYDNPGDYYFSCTVHAGQGGKLIVE